MIKTIFIIWIKRLDVNRGGVHRIIHVLMDHLPQYGYKVHYLYTEDDYHTFHHFNDIDEKEPIQAINLKQWLTDNQCDLIIGQDGSVSHVLSDMFYSWGNTRMKYVTVFHSSVLLLEKVFSPHHWFWTIRHGRGKQRVIALIRLLAYPLWIKKCREFVKKNIKINCSAANRIILLSSKELPIIQRYAPEASELCSVINNSLSWGKIYDESILQEKTKEVLIVSRLYNPEKRIDRALRVWQRIEEYGLDEWNLRIVGFGIHEQYLKDLAWKLGLKRVYFEGQQSAEQYYRKASIFMMTSAVEGWGLTLTESMQTGVVPIAFDSYPALHDIITDGYDGFIVPDDNINEYARILISLIQDKELREKIARNCLISSKRFEIDKIIPQWVNLIKSL